VLRFRIPERQAGNRGIGLSYGGRCPRATAYRHRGFAETPHPHLDPTRRFLALEVGRALHEQVRSLLEDVRDMERRVRVEVAPGLLVEGHIDGLVPHPEDGSLLLLELKTMSPYGFEKLQKGEEVERSYLVQVNLYLEALLPEGIDRALFVALNKADGNLHTRILPFDPALAEEGKENLRKALTLPPEAIERPYAPDEKGRLPWQCAYCEFWAHCWPEAKPNGERGKPILTL